LLVNISTKWWRSQ